jgi:DNA-binding transcriptional regulator YiaG
MKEGDAMRRTTAKRTGPTLGLEIIAGLSQAVAAARTGGLPALRKKYTVRRVRRSPFAQPTLGPADVAAIRISLAASQAVFAGLIGVSAGTVRAWEQGRKTPSSLARCLLAEVRRNRAYWQERLRLAERRA